MYKWRRCCIISKRDQVWHTNINHACNIQRASQVLPNNVSETIFVTNVLVLQLHGRVAEMPKKNVLVITTCWAPIASASYKLLLSVIQLTLSGSCYPGEEYATIRNLVHYLTSSQSPQWRVSFYEKPPRLEGDYDFCLVKAALYMLCQRHFFLNFHQNL